MAAAKKGFGIELGATVQDKVTRFQGRVISRCETVDGVRSYGVQGTELKDGVPTDPHWLNEGRLVVVKSKAPKS